MRNDPYGMDAPVGSEVLQALAREEQGQRFALALGLVGNTTMATLAIAICLLVSQQTLFLVLAIGLARYTAIAAGAGLLTGLLCWLLMVQHILPAMQRDVALSIRYSEALPQLLEHPAPWELLPRQPLPLAYRGSKPGREGLAQRLNFIAWRWNALLAALGYRFRPSVPGWVAPLVVGVLLCAAIYLLSADLQFGIGIGLAPLASLSLTAGQARHVAALRALRNFFIEQAGNADLS
ncbi:hypothetical protein KDL29_03895 [bacterium]|nr:hypothetical protein [bacterium]